MSNDAIVGAGPAEAVSDRQSLTPPIAADSRIRREGLPADHLYWDVLPVELRRASLRAQAAHMEAVLPVDVESLHLCRTLLADGRTLIIGIEPDRLRRAILDCNQRGSSHWSLVPQALPEAIATMGVADGDCQRLELLTGTFEPAARRRLRLARAWTMIAAAIVIALIVLWGAERRVGIARADAEHVRTEIDQAITLALPPEPSALALNKPQVRLANDIVRLAALADANQSGDRWQDLTPIAQGFAQQWPTDLRMHTESMTLSRDRLTIRARLLRGEDGERLARVLSAQPIAGSVWQAEPVQVTPLSSAGSTDVAVVVTLLRKGGAKP